VTVERVEGAFKLNQTKSDADALSVADALSEQKNSDAWALGGLLRGRTVQPAK
jgi:predicted FMN-binding regulatory protein PaiB